MHKKQRSWLRNSPLFRQTQSTTRKEKSIQKGQDFCNSEENLSFEFMEREREKGKRNWWKLRALNSPRQRLLLVYILLSTFTLGLFFCCLWIITSWMTYLNKTLKLVRPRRNCLLTCKFKHISNDTIKKGVKVKMK